MTITEYIYLNDEFNMRIYVLYKQGHLKVEFNFFINIYFKKGQDHPLSNLLFLIILFFMLDF